MKNIVSSENKNGIIKIECETLRNIDLGRSVLSFFIPITPQQKRTGNNSRLLLCLLLLYLVDILHGFVQIFYQSNLDPLYRNAPISSRLNRKGRIGFYKESEENAWICLSSLKHKYFVHVLFNRGDKKTFDLSK